jgi:hypothetical protein
MNAAATTGPDRPGRTPRADRAGRALLDELLAAFHFACDIKDLDIARRLLATTEKLATSMDDAAAGKRRALAGIVAAHERLWALQQAADPFS